MNIRQYLEEYMSALQCDAKFDYPTEEQRRNVLSQLCKILILISKFLLNGRNNWNYDLGSSCIDFMVTLLENLSGEQKEWFKSIGNIVPFFDNYEQSYKGSLDEQFDFDQEFTYVIPNSIAAIKDHLYCIKDAICPKNNIYWIVQHITLIIFKMVDRLDIYDEDKYEYQMQQIKKMVDVLKMFKSLEQGNIVSMINQVDICTSNYEEPDNSDSEWSSESDPDCSSIESDGDYKPIFEWRNGKVSRIIFDRDDELNPNGFFTNDNAFAVVN